MCGHDSCLSTSSERGSRNWWRGGGGGEGKEGERKEVGKKREGAKVEVGQCEKERGKEEER